AMRPTAPRRRSSSAREPRPLSTGFTRRLDASSMGWRPSKRLRRRREPGKRRTTVSICGLFGLRSADEGNLDRDADQILDLDAIAGLDVACDRLGSNSRVVDLTVGILDIREEHVPRYLTVDAHW